MDNTSKNAQAMQFLNTAKVAAELYFAMRVAKDLSLTAKNARVIAVRAGEQMASFRAITNFIEELSNTTIKLSISINEIAIRVSRIAVNQARSCDARERIARVFNQQLLFLDSITGHREKIFLNVEKNRENFDTQLRTLSAELEEAQKQIRTAGVIASSSKIETSRSGIYEHQLNVIASNIEQAASQVKRHLTNARLLLDELQDSLRFQQDEKQ